MVKSPIIFAMVVLAAFVAGVMAGDYLASPLNGAQPAHPGSAAAPSSSSSATDWSGRELEEEGLRSHTADLEHQLADAKAKEDAAILNDRLAFYKKYNLAPESFGDDLRVTPAMAEYLKMSDAEKKMVESHLAQIHAQIQSLEKQHLKLVTQTDTSVSYEIEPFTEGNALKEQMKQLVEGDLGVDRGDLFLDSAAWEMNRDFVGFGVGKTGLQVTQTDQGGPPTYQITETFANGSAEEHSSAGADLPPEFKGLIQVDPNP